MEMFDNIGVGRSCSMLDAPALSCLYTEECFHIKRQDRLYLEALCKGRHRDVGSVWLSRDQEGGVWRFPFGIVMKHRKIGRNVRVCSCVCVCVIEPTVNAKVDPESGELSSMQGGSGVSLCATDAG